MHLIVNTKKMNMLLLFTGLPGSGKTTLAKAYAVRYGAEHLNSDVLRREMGLLGRYGPEDKEKVYRMLLERTRQLLSEGKTVIVDSTFYKESIRAPFREIAEALSVPLYWVEVGAQENVIRERLKTARPDSEADFDVYKQIRDAYEPIPGPHLFLYSDDNSLDRMTDLVHAYLQQ